MTKNERSRILQLNDLARPKVGEVRYSSYVLKAGQRTGDIKHKFLVWTLCITCGDGHWIRRSNKSEKYYCIKCRNRERMINNFIGRKFNHNQIEVIGRGVSGNSNKAWKIKCNVCAKDPELFGDAIFYTSKLALEHGRFLCGCKKAIHFTKSQIVILVKRRCELRCHRFIRFVGDYKTCWSRIVVQCKNGHTWKPTINSFLGADNSGYCIKCMFRKSDDIIIKSFFNTGKFLLGTKFWRGETRIVGKKSPRPTYTWYYTCPSCSNDKYVNAGVCSGVFVSDSSSLQAGQLSCRCSTHVNWSKEQRVFQVNEIIRTEKLQYKCLGLVNKEFGIPAKLRIVCEKHGEFNPQIHAFVDMGSRCPSCAQYGFDPSLLGVFYVIDAGKFTGYGISNYIENRLNDHKLELKKHELIIHNVYRFKMDGKEAVDLENLVKKTFPVVSQDIAGFVKEATHHHLLKDVINCAEEYVNKNGMTGRKI